MKNIIITALLTTAFFLFIEPEIFGFLLIVNGILDPKPTTR